MNDATRTRIGVIALASTLGLLFACADVMNTLEENTSSTTTLGKLVRGANQVRKSYEDFDPAEEHFIGRAVAAQLLQRGYDVSKDETLTSYVERVGQAIVYTNDDVRHTFQGYRFAVLDTDEVNAFATPGGIILITRGMIAATHSEDELAAVLAHEVAHVTLMHGLAAIQEGTRLAAFQSLAETVGEEVIGPGQMDKLSSIFGDSVDDIVVELAERGYDRDKEYEADRTADRYVRNAGYRSGALAAFLSRFEGEGGLFSTHPSSGDRLSELGSPTLGPVAPDALAAREERYRRCLGH